MSRQVNIELLEKYLAGEIESREVLDIDGKVLNNDELQDAIKDHKELILQIEGAALKESLKEINSAERPQAEDKKLVFWLRTAASVVLIFVLGFLILKPESPRFEDYFEHFEQLETFRGPDSQSFDIGLTEYSRRNYSRAYELLTSKNLEELSPELTFYAGLSALGSERFEEAIVLFEAIGTKETNKYYQQTKWYLALAYWQSGQKLKSIDMLNTIKRGEFQYLRSRDLARVLED